MQQLFIEIYFAIEHYKKTYITKIPVIIYYRFNSQCVFCKCHDNKTILILIFKHTLIKTTRKYTRYAYSEGKEEEGRGEKNEVNY